jgi:hypothetical protein
MPEYFDAEALLADCRRKQRRAGEVARRARRKLGVETGARRSPTYLTDGLTAEEIERDTRSIYKVLAIWRKIGKTSASPLTLPSGKRLVPKTSSTAGRARREYAVTRPRRRRGVSA